MPGGIGATLRRHQRGDCVGGPGIPAYFEARSKAGSDRASELLAKSSFLAPKRRLDAWLLLEQVASCLAILAVVLCAVA